MDLSPLTVGAIETVRRLTSGLRPEAIRLAILGLQAAEDSVSKAEPVFLRYRDLAHRATETGEDSGFKLGVAASVLGEATRLRTTWRKCLAEVVTVFGWQLQRLQRPVEHESHTYASACHALATLGASGESAPWHLVEQASEDAIRLIDQCPATRHSERPESGRRSTIAETGLTIKDVMSALEAAGLPASRTTALRHLSTANIKPQRVGKRNLYPPAKVETMIGRASTRDS